MEHNDEIVEIIDDLAIALKDYFNNVIIKIANKEEFLKSKSAHIVFQDEINYSLIRLEKFKPTSILDQRKSVLTKHFKKLLEQNKKIINTFDKSYSIDSVKEFSFEVEAMINLLNEIMSELKRRT